MKKLFFILLTAFIAFNASAQTIRQQRIPTPYEFEGPIKFTKPPELSSDTTSNAPNRSIAVIGGKIFVKDTTWKELTASGEPGPQGATGPTGAAGANGNKWYEGAGEPSGGSYSIGDFFLNRTSGDFFEKTGASTWLVRGNLKGPQGATGLQGPQGVAGINGTNGTNGTNGATGAQGPKGDPGRGVTILGSLENTSALPGSGIPGDGYLIDGGLWVWDDVGSDWDSVGNIQGPQGDPGETGAAGAPGSKIYDLAGTPVAGNGNIGDFYINRTNGDYYEKTGVSTWTLRGNIKGPQGDPGPVGSEPATQIVYGTGTAVTSSPNYTWNNGIKNLKISSSSYAQITLSDGTDTIHIRSIKTGVGMGKFAQQSVTTGISNYSFGNNSGQYITTGSGNSNFGSQSGRFITTGSYNTNLGLGAGYNLTTGSDNTMVGMAAGQQNEDAEGGVITGHTNTFIGAYTGSSSNQKQDVNYSTAIGFNAYTTRNYQIVFGRGFSYEVQLLGKVAINNGKYTLPHASSSLDVNDSTTGVVFTRLTSAQRTAIESPVEGLLVYDKTIHSYHQFNGTAWENLKSASGTNGSKWYDQPGTPSGALGAVGDFYIDRTSVNYYEKTGTSIWTLRGSLKGGEGTGTGGGNFISSF